MPLYSIEGEGPPKPPPPRPNPGLEPCMISHNELIREVIRWLINVEREGYQTTNVKHIILCHIMMVEETKNR